MFVNLKKAWKLVPGPSVFYNNFLKKWLGLKKKQNYILDHFRNISFEISKIQKRFSNALAIFLAIYQKEIVVWNKFLVSILYLIFGKTFFMYCFSLYSHQCTKYHYQTFLTSEDIKQNAFLNCCFVTWWRHKPEHLSSFRFSYRLTNSFQEKNAE